MAAVKNFSGCVSLLAIPQRVRCPRGASSGRAHIARLCPVQAMQSTSDASARLRAQLLVDRRLLLAGCVLFTQQGSTAAWPDAAIGGEDVKVYNDSKYKFSVAIPSSFEQQEKAGATALFIDPNRKSTKVGVTVNPVRVPVLSQFGSLQDVGDKLLGAEQAKESTLDCVLLYQQDRSLESGVTFYEYGYELNNTRGRKRIQTSVTINNSKLYILNTEVKCEKETCEGTEDVVAMLKAVVASFAVQ